MKSSLAFFFFFKFLLLQDRDRVEVNGDCLFARYG